MTDRKKLVELIAKFCGSLTLNDVKPPYGVENLADNLISHGVTFAKDTDAPGKWISVDDRLPQEAGEICENVNLLMDNGFVTVGWLNQVTNKGYYLDSYNDVIIRAPLTRFTHWMPLPLPPKEE